MPPQVRLHCRGQLPVRSAASASDFGFGDTAPPGRVAITSEKSFSEMMTQDASKRVDVGRRDADVGLQPP